MGSATKKNRKRSKSPAPKAPEPQVVMEEDDDDSEKEDLDYGATADAFASASDDSSVEDNTKKTAGKKGKNGTKGPKDEDDNEDDSSSEEEEDDRDDNILETEEKEKGDQESSSDEEEDAEEEEDSEDDDNDEEEVAEPDLAFEELPAEAGEEACSFDLRNLTAVNPHPLQETALYKKKNKKSDEENLTINTLQSSSQINDDYILQKATEGCTQLIHALWQLPNEKSDAGPQVILPSYDKIDIPRALPPPPPKTETRWEKFAKQRGISINKEKRSRKVWDEATNSWKFRHGYDKANAETSDDTKGRPGGMWPIMEVGANDDPYADPWEKVRDEKHKRVEQNRLSRLSNQERAGVVPKGMTRRVAKAREQTREAGRAGGRLDVPLPAAPTGVPVDLSGKTLRGKTSINAALKLSQVSTASLGKFDKMREGEPERKLLLKASKKRKAFLDDDTTSKTTGREQERAAKVLQTVLNGGGVEKEKARKKGKLAKGVSAYDYEYDDGADNVLFRKKKGRGGMGKNRKMTKKRIK